MEYAVGYIEDSICVYERTANSCVCKCVCVRVRDLRSFKCQEAEMSEGVIEFRV